MLKDRKRITHTDREETAIDIDRKIKKEHIRVWNDFIEKFDTKIL